MTTLFDFSAFPILDTPRLHLRQMTHADAEAIMELFSDPRVLAYLNQDPTDTRDKAIGMIDWLNGGYERHEFVTWAITVQGQPRLIGMCGNYAWEKEHRRADIGYHILPSQWGKGYATEAAHAILAWTFEHFDLHRIQADTTSGNIASERVMLKCGFQLEGVWREQCWEHGRFVDIKQFGLLRREYRPQD